MNYLRYVWICLCKRMCTLSMAKSRTEYEYIQTDVHMYVFAGSVHYFTLNCSQGICLDVLYDSAADRKTDV